MIVEVDIPDVSAETIGRHRILRKIGFNAGPPTHAEYALLESLIRLTENAAFEYMQGKAAILRIWNREDDSSMEISAVFRAASHFETCLSDTHRALNHVANIRKRHDVLVKSRKKLPSSMNIYSRAQCDQIRKVRNTIQHKEKELLNGRIAEFEPFALHATGDKVPTADDNVLKTIDRLKIGKKCIYFSTIAQTIEELREFSEALVVGEYGAPGPYP